MAIALSLLAALSYGLSDFVGGLASRRTSPWTIALLAQVGGAATMLLVSLLADGSPSSADLAWAVLAGAGNGIGTAFLYRGLAAGRMGVVGPVSGVGAALVPVVVGVATGERPGALATVGIALALPAIWLVAREPASDASAAAVDPAEPVDTGGGRRTAAGLVDGVLAGIGFGVLFAALAQIPEESGFLPLALNQVVGAVLIVAIASAVRAPWVPRARGAAIGLLPGVLGATATGLFLVATHHGYLTVAAVITSLYPAFTVVLAAVVLHEHVRRDQALGLALCGAAVGLIAAA